MTQMDTPQTKPCYERIKFLQTQLRTAIQNHHVLLLKSRLVPQDNDIKNHMNILQSLIISMGRTQNELLRQLEKEKETCKSQEEFITKCLTWPIPPNVPVFKGELVKCGKKSILKTYGGMGSRIKITHGSDGNTNLKQVLQHPESKGFIKIDLDGSASTKIPLITTPDEPECTSPKRRRTQDSDDSKSDSRAESIVSECAESANAGLVNSDEICKPVVVKKKFESKTVTRSKRRLATVAAVAAAKAASLYKSDTVDLNVLEESLKNGCDGTEDKVLKHKELCDGMGQSKFLEIFSLISVSEREALTSKKCGRKRRTVAGQSSLYNDYLKPSTFLKNPSLKYDIQRVKKSCRVAPVMKRNRAESQADDEESGGQETSSQNSVVVEASADFEDDEEKDKERPCIVCRAADGCLEVCSVCGERFHSSCCNSKDLDAKNRCPLCLDQLSSIQLIVGEGGVVSSASSIELIKRYLPT